MDDMIGPGRAIRLAGAAGSAGATAVEVVTKTELIILNVPLSMLMVAIAGTMIGFVILPSKDAARISPAPDATGYKRILYVLYSLALIGVAVIGYALLSAWIVQAGVGIIQSVFKGWRVEDGVIMPAAGIIGIGIRIWLPALLKAVERRADRVIGGSA